LRIFAQALHLTQEPEGRKCHVDAKTGLAYITTTLTTSFSFLWEGVAVDMGGRSAGWRWLHASPLIGHNYWI